MSVIALSQVEVSVAGIDGPQRLLDNINLQVPENAVVAIVGSSGAGKSSLLRTLNGLLPVTTGDVSVLGVSLSQLDYAALSRLRQRVGFVFQDYRLLSTRTVYDNIVLPLRLQGTNIEAEASFVNEIMSICGLNECLDRYPVSLSGGQRQRVAIARSLVLRPSILLCDEITSALDPHTTRRIIQLLQQLKRQFDLTIVIVTHEIDCVLQIADHVVVMDQGHIVEQAPLVEFFSDPQSEAGKALLEAGYYCQLPESFSAQLHADYQLGDSALLRIQFPGHHAVEPIVYNLMQRVGQPMNVLSAQLHMIRDQSLGEMLVAVSADDIAIKVIIEYLLNQSCRVEECGYVQLAPK